MTAEAVLAKGAYIFPTTNKNAHIAAVTLASSPSTPSVKLEPLTVPMTINASIGIPIQPSVAYPVVNGIRNLNSPPALK